MPNPIASQITPPRVPFFDQRTGDISREWYRWFYNLYVVTGGLNQNVIQPDHGGTGTYVIPENGQLLIGNSVTHVYNVADLGTGPGIDATVGPGTLSIENTGVLSFSGGTTGLTPSTATTGNVTLAGTLDVDNGGTGATNAAGARANLSAAVLGANNDITSMSALTGGISAPAYIEFDTTPGAVSDVARLSWNASDQTLDLGMEYDVTQQIGQETYARVRNTTGSTIPNGSVVGFAGAATDALLVTPYIADGSLPTLYILGIMTHDLPDSGEKGYCTTWGFVRDIDTSAFSAGDVLYASPSIAGELTNVKPTAPDNVIPIAACVVSDATNGVIFVRPTIQQQQYYGQFSRTTDTSPAAINTAYPIVMSGLDIGNGVVLGTPASRIVVPQSGLYTISANLQLTSGSATDKNVWFWVRKNGTDVANSARLVTVSVNNAYTVVSLREEVSLNANEYIELCWAADSTNVTLDAVAATAFAPAAPAVVVNVTQAQQ